MTSHSTKYTQHSCSKQALLSWKFTYYYQKQLLQYKSS